MVHTLTHESRHVRDIAKTRRCDVWNDPAMQIILGASRFPATYEGYEDYTHHKTLESYKEHLGVYSPRDARYVAATDGAVSCPLQ